MQKKLCKHFPDAEDVSCLKICKGPVLIINGTIFTKIRKKKHLEWLLNYLETGIWDGKLEKHIKSNKKKSLEINYP